jgi:hypothetical protein
MRRGAALAWVGLGAMFTAGTAWAQGFPISEEVVTALRAQDCRRAVELVQRDANTGSANGLLAAGWLYERGLCIKANPDQAYKLYLRAHALKSPAAAMRLAGLSASGEGGFDVAATLWWAREAGLGAAMTEQCDPVPGETTVTIDRFIERLKLWPADQLKVCGYVAGLWALTLSDVRYPWRVRNEQGDGLLTLSASLPAGQVEVQSSNANVGQETRGMLELIVRDAQKRLPRLPSTLPPQTHEIQLKLSQG